MMLNIQKYTLVKIALEESSAINKRLILDAGFTKVYLVNGFELRKNMIFDWIGGGNEKAYTNCPKGEVWLEDMVNKADIKCNMMHEMFEVLNMKYNGLPYEKAHAISNKYGIRLLEGESAQKVIKEFVEKELNQKSEKRTLNYIIPTMVKAYNGFDESYDKVSGTKSTVNG